MFLCICLFHIKLYYIFTYIRVNIITQSEESKENEKMLIIIGIVLIKTKNQVMNFNIVILSISNKGTNMLTMPY